MLEIQIDLQLKHTFLAQACFAANAHCKAKLNLLCNLKRDQKLCDTLEDLLQKWCFLTCSEKEKVLFPFRVKDLSQKQYYFYTTQKKHYQANANAYIEWYDCPCECSHNDDSIHYYNETWKINECPLVDT